MILEKAKAFQGYRLHQKNINAVCYADDVVFVVETEDDCSVSYTFLSLQSKNII